jgi:hypothetical protein
MANDRQHPPLVDDRVEFHGSSYLRSMNIDNLRKLTKIVVIQDTKKRLVVVVPYQMYCEIQSGQVKFALAASELLETLKWLDRQGGLGLDKHERIRAVIDRAEGKV